MKIKRIRTLNNPNIYSYQPTLLMRLVIEEADEKFLSENPDYFALLEKIISKAGKKPQKMREIKTADNSLAVIVKNVALGLINLAGFGLSNGIVRFSGDAGVYEIAVEFRYEEATRFLLRTSVDTVEAALKNESFEISGAIREAQKLRAENELEPNAKIVVEAAEKRGIPWSLENSVIQLGHGRNLRRIQSAMTDETSVLANNLVGNDEDWKRRLEKFSIPVFDSENLIKDQFDGKKVRILVINGKTGIAIEYLTADSQKNTDVTNEIHQTIKNLCERAARVVGLDICEIRMIAPDISAPLPKTKAGIVGIKANPDLQIYTFSDSEKPHDVGGAIVEMLYPNDKSARIPLVAITGTNGKTTVTRLTAHVLRETGLNIGTTTTDGILFNGEKNISGDTTGPASARVILDDSAVDIAVLETARGGIMRRGLGWDWAEIAVITNISEDHIGQDGIESVTDLADVKSLIAERVIENGTLILNADDKESTALAERESVLETKKRIVYFAISEENPILKKHFETGETTYFVRENRICEKRGVEVLTIAETTLIPITMNGTADFQIQNAMAVSAVSRTLGLSPEKIAAGLYSFQNQIHNPGRSNFYRVGKGFALIDYGHNPKAMEAICRMTSRWTGKTITGIISFPGDRRDDVIEAAGRIAVAGFDRIIVKGDVNLRGRASGEVAEMLCRIVLETGNQSDCKIVMDAAQAFDDAIAEIKENEVVVFFYEKLAPVLATLEKYGAEATTTF